MVSETLYYSPDLEFIIEEVVTPVENVEDLPPELLDGDIMYLDITPQESFNLIEHYLVYSPNDGALVEYSVRHLPAVTDSEPRKTRLAAELDAAQTAERLVTAYGNAVEVAHCRAVSVSNPALVAEIFGAKPLPETLAEMMPEWCDDDVRAVVRSAFGAAEHAALEEQVAASVADTKKRLESRRGILQTERWIPMFSGLPPKRGTGPL